MATVQVLQEQVTAVEKAQGSLQSQHNVLRQDHNLLEIAHQALLNSYNWSITSINTTGQQIVATTKSMSESIADRIREYGDTIAKQVTNRGDRKVEQIMMAAVHLKFFNTLRKENPEKYKELVSIATLIIDKPLDVQNATVAYYFGEAEAVKIVDTLRRIEIQKKIKSLQQSNEPIPNDLLPYVKDAVDMNNPPVNLSLTNLQFHTPTVPAESKQRAS